MLPLMKTSGIVEKRAGRIPLAKRETGRIVRRFEKKGVEVRVYSRMPVFADSRVIEGGGKARRALLLNEEILQILESSSRQARERLVDLAFDFETHVMRGATEEQAFDELSRAFTALPEEAKKAVLKALESPEIDPGNEFRDFLIYYPAAHANDRKRLTALLKSRQLVDIPYDRMRAFETEKMWEDDLASLRLQTLQVLSDTYDATVDRENARRVFRHCLENGKRLLVCRFGRAFYTDALLLADSKCIRSSGIRREISRLEKENQKLSGYDKGLKIGPELQRVVNLATEEWISLASFKGALSRLKESLRSFEVSRIEEFDDTHEAMGQVANPRPI